MSNTYVLHTSEKDREREGEREGARGICNSTKCSGISRASLVQHFHFQVHEIWWRSVLVNAWAVAELPLPLSRSLSLSHSLFISISICISLGVLTIGFISLCKAQPQNTSPNPDRSAALSLALPHSHTGSLARTWLSSTCRSANTWMAKWNIMMTVERGAQRGTERNGTERSERREIEIESVYCELQNNEL